MPEFDFDPFIENIMSEMKEAVATTAHNINVNNIGEQTYNGRSYYCYKTVLSTNELACLFKPTILYSLNSSELQAYMDTLYDKYYSHEDMSDDNLYFDYDIDMSSQMSGIAVMLDSYWSMIVTELESHIGENIEVTIYVTEAMDNSICTVSLENGTVFDLDNITNQELDLILENIKYYYEQIFNTY